MAKTSTPEGRDDRVAAAVGLSPLDAALQLIRRGRTEALPHFRSELEKHPEVWRRYGDIAGITECAWAEQIADGEPLVRESILKTIKSMKDELLGPEPSPLERLLVERLACAKLQLHHADCMDLNLVQAGDRGSPTAAFVLKRQDAASRRLLHAVKELATVRRLVAGLKVEITHTAAVAGAASDCGGGGSNGQNGRRCAAAEGQDDGRVGGRLTELSPTPVG